MGRASLETVRPLKFRNLVDSEKISALAPNRPPSTSNKHDSATFVIVTHDSSGVASYGALGHVPPLKLQSIPCRGLTHQGFHYH
jgi:hypothetical protein